MAPTAAQIESVRALVRESVSAVDALAPSALHALAPALRTARDELRRDLSAWLSKVDDGANRFGAFQRQQALRAMEGALERVAELEPAMAQSLRQARHLTGPLAVANLDTELQRLGALFGGGIPVMPQISTAAVIAQGDRLLWRQHKTSAKRYAGAIGDDVKQMLAVGVAKGETFEQLVTRLRKIRNPGAKAKSIDPGADAGDIADGLFGRYRWWGERLVRTEMMHAYNVQHDEAVEQANDQRPEGDEEYLRRWDAAADVRVCPLCRELDGRVTTIKGRFPGGITSPPRHPCCRCVVLAWMRRWGDMPGETGARGEVPETKRKSIGEAKPEAKKAAPAKPKKIAAPNPVPPLPPPKKPKPAPKALPPVPQLQPAQQAAPAAKAFIEAVKKFDYSGAVKEMDRAYAEMGLVPSAAKNGTVKSSDDGLRMKNHSGQEITANGVRHWDGRIQISGNTEKQLHGYAKAFGDGQRPDELIKAHDERLDALSNYRHKHKSKLPKEKDAELSGETTAEGVRRINGDLAAAKGVNVLVHEGLHGWSPVASGGYSHHGGILEEVTNETATRHVLKNMFGIPQSWRGGAYDGDISAVLDAIGEVTGSKSRDAQWQHLQTASMRFKRRKDKLTNAPEVVTAFAEDVAATIGAKPMYTESILQRHLDIFAHGQARLAQ